MGVATGVKSERRYTRIKEACHRNTAAELHYDGGDGELVTARVRLLGLDRQHVFTDRPPCMGKPLVFSPRQAVLVCLPLGGVPVCSLADGAHAVPRTADSAVHRG